MGHGHLDCIICGAPIDAEGPGVCQIKPADGETSWSWVAFIEDWRGGYVDLIHPACFASTYGVPALVAAVHRRDLVIRPSN